MNGTRRIAARSVWFYMIAAFWIGLFASISVIAWQRAAPPRVKAEADVEQSKDASPSPDPSVSQGWVTAPESENVFRAAPFWSNRRVKVDVHETTNVCLYVAYGELDQSTHGTTVAITAVLKRDLPPNAGCK